MEIETAKILRRSEREEIDSHRLEWLEARRRMENERSRHHKMMSFFNRRMEGVYPLAKSFLDVTGLSKITQWHAKRVRCREIELSFPNLPEAFEGFTLLHLTDPHFDALPGIENEIIKALPKQPVDLFVMTGDYRAAVRGAFEQVFPAIRKVVGAVEAREGRLAVLGNHDTWEMVSAIESAGAKCLLNESIRLRRGGQEILVTGLDDVHIYYTPKASKALATDTKAFKIALVHSNEILREASSAKYSFYVCGHTHGGQICLPFGIPIITHSNEHRRFSRGLWSFDGMKGYTSPGAGSVSLPARAFCHAEITLFRFKRST